MLPAVPDLLVVLAQADADANGLRPWFGHLAGTVVVTHTAEAIDELSRLPPGQTAGCVLIPDFASTTAARSVEMNAHRWFSEQARALSSGGFRRLVAVLPASAWTGLHPHGAAALGIRFEITSLAREWGAVGTTFNAVAVEDAPSGRDRQPVTEAAPALRFLTSSAAGYVTAAVIQVGSIPVPVQPEPTTGVGRPGVVIVTGGTSGLGRACAERIAASGWTVAALSREARDSPVPWYECDVTDFHSGAAACAAIQRDLGPIEGLVCCAGAGRRSLARLTEPAAFADLIDLNLIGAFNLVRAALPSMSTARRGAIVLISSSAALIGDPGLSAYNSAKSGLHGLARTLANEYGPRQISANAVCPGILDNAADKVPKAVADGWMAATPVGRPGTLDECASVVDFLISQPGRCVSGQVIPVDGGMSVAVGAALR